MTHEFAKIWIFALVSTKSLKNLQDFPGNLQKSPFFHRNVSRLPFYPSRLRLSTTGTFPQLSEIILRLPAFL